MANVFCLYYGLCLCWPHSRYMRCLCFASFSNCLNFFFFGLHFDYAVALFLRSPMESDRWANVVGISLVQLIISTRCVVNIFVGAVRSIVYPVCVVRVKPILFFFFIFIVIFIASYRYIWFFFFFRESNYQSTWYWTISICSVCQMPFERWFQRCKNSKKNKTKTTVQTKNINDMLDNEKCWIQPFFYTENYTAL